MNPKKKIKLLQSLEYEENKQFLKRPTSSMNEFMLFKETYQTSLSSMLQNLEYIVFETIYNDETKEKYYKTIINTLKRLEDDKKDRNGVIENYKKEIESLDIINGEIDAVIIYLKIAKPKKYKQTFKLSIKKMIVNEEKIKIVINDIKDSPYFISFIENGRRYNDSTKMQLEKAYEEYEKMTNSILARYKRLAVKLSEGND